MDAIAKLRPSPLLSSVAPTPSSSGCSSNGRTVYPLNWRFCCGGSFSRELPEGVSELRRRWSGGKAWSDLVVGRREARVQAWRWSEEDVAAAGEKATFAEGVEFFNAREYYECHDVLEGLWNDSSEPQRSILHGILQCAVGLYHLLHQNHRGAMVELGEGLTKLRRASFKDGPLHDFEREASAVLEFIYHTQLEHAACVEDVCITMDGSEQSYQLLGNFGAGQALYKLSSDDGGNGEIHIEFLPQRLQVSSLEIELKPPPPLTVKVPILRASEENLYSLT